jgi:UDP-glucose 4-epimerase
MSNLARVKTLVTGGAGFIGSHVVDALLARGHEVAVIDNLSKFGDVHLAGALAAGARLHEVDIRDGERVAEVFAEEKPEVVFHLAAQTRVRYSVEHPDVDAGSNVSGTVNVLTAARAAGARRLVNSSTGGAIYGECESLPIPETQDPNPISPYGVSKQAAEGYCRLYADLHGLSTVSLRYSNVYGPRQDSTGEGGVIATFCGQLLAGEPWVVFGDGEQTRDFVFVGDVVEANLLAVASEVTGPVNIGSGRQTSVLDLIEDLRRIRPDDAPEAELAPARPGEIRHSAIDPAYASEALGWTPAVSVAGGVARTLQSIEDARDLAVGRAE